MARPANGRKEAKNIALSTDKKSAPAQPGRAATVPAIQDIFFSGFKGVNPWTDAHWCIQDVLSILTDEKRAERTARIRSLSASMDFLKSLESSKGAADTLEGFKAEKAKLKNSLPASTFSAYIERGKARAANNVSKHTGFFILDFDHVANFDQAYKTLKNAPYTLLIFRSPSGDGIKVLTFAEGATPETHKLYFYQIARFYDSLIEGITVDPSGNDIARLCFLPYEPTAELNESALPFPVNLAAIKQAQIRAAERLEARRQATAKGIPYDAAEALENARSDVDELYKKKGISFDDGKHVWIATFSIYAKHYGATEEQAREYVYQNILPENKIDTDPFAPFRNDKYPQGDWKKEAPAEQRPRQYLSGEKADILQAIEAHDRLIIPVHTGAGKSRVFLALIEGFIGIAHELANIHGRVTFAVPTTSLAEQLGEKYNIPYLTGRKTGETTAEMEERVNIAISARVCIAVWDKVYLRPDIGVFIGDEAHDMPKATNYRKSADVTFSALMRAKKAILLTATPPPGIELLGFKVYRSKLKPWQRVKLFPYLLRKDKKTDDRLFSELRRLDYSEGIAIAYINSKPKGKLLAARLQKLLPEGMRATTINSDERGKDYEYLIANNRLPDDVAICIVTKFIEYGIDINNENIKGIFAVPSMGAAPDPADIIQLAGRARNLHTVPLHLFLHPREGEKVGTPAEIKQAIWKAANDLVSRCKEVQNTARLECLEGYRADTLEAFDRCNFVRYGENGAPEIAPLNILAAINHEINKSFSTGDYLQEICKRAPHFELGITVSEKGQSSKELTAYQEEKAEQRKAAKKADAMLCELLVNNFNTTLEAAFFASPDRSVKMKIRSFAGTIGREESPQAYRMRAKHKDVFENTTFRPLHVYFELYSTGHPADAIGAALTSLHEQSKAKDLTRLEGEIERLERTIESRNNYDTKKADKLEKATAAAQKLREDLVKLSAEIERRKDSTRATAKGTAALIEKAKAKRAKLKAKKQDITERREAEAGRMPDRLEATAVLTQELKRKREYLRELRELYSTGLYINPSTYNRFKSSFKSLYLLHLTQGKARRERMTATLPHLAIEAGKLRKFRGLIAKSKGRNLTTNQIINAWRKASKTQAVTAYDKIQLSGLKSDALERFKDLFEYSKEGQKFRVICAKNWQKNAQSIGLKVDFMRAEKQPLKRIEGVFSSELSKMDVDDYLTIYKRDKALLTKIKVHKEIPAPF